jgi:HEPN domain-containing protein
MILDVTKDWIRASNYDLLTIEKIVDIDYLTHIVAFHSQQSIEKSLKALIVFKEIDIPKIHSLNRLFKLTEYIIENYDIQIVNKLDKLYIDSRYPSEFGLLPYGKPTLTDAREFYEFALSIFDRVCKILDINKSELLL